MRTIKNKAIIENLERAINIWNSKLAEIWGLLTTSPEDFKGGAVWGVIQQIYSAIQGVGYSLLVLFFLAGMIRTTTSPQDLRRPETVFKLFLRFVIAKGVITYGMDILIAIMEIPQGMVTNIISSLGLSGTEITAELPEAMKAAISAVRFTDAIPLWCVALISKFIIMALSFVLILTVYGRFFRFYMFAAMSPIPLAGLAGEGTHLMAQGFFKNYIAVCLEVVAIALACIIYSAIVSSPPTPDETAEAVTQVWDYVGEIIFNMLVLVGAVKQSDRLVHELMGI